MNFHIDYSARGSHRPYRGIFDDMRIADYLSARAEWQLSEAHLGVGEGDDLHLAIQGFYLIQSILEVMSLLDRDDVERALGNTFGLWGRLDGDHDDA